MFKDKEIRNIIYALKPNLAVKILKSEYEFKCVSEDNLYLLDKYKKIRSLLNIEKEAIESAIGNKEETIISKNDLLKSEMRFLNKLYLILDGDDNDK